MTKLNFKFDYPIVIKRVGGFLTLSVPDVGISRKFTLPDNGSTCTSDEFLKHIEDLINETESHVKTKSWQPKSSVIRDVLNAPAGELTLPEFCARLKERIKISENTIRREIEKGSIISTFTSGGHRRIPETEVIRYLNQQAKTP